MVTSRLDRALALLAGVEPVVGMLWIGLVALSITLIVLMRTRWGQARPLRKCLALSVLAHLLLAGYATTVQIICGLPSFDEPVMCVSFVDGPTRQAAGAEDPVSEEKPWEEFLHDKVAQPEPVEPRRESPQRMPELQRQTPSDETRLPGDPSLDHLVAAEIRPPEPTPQPPVGSTGRSTPGKAAEPVEAPEAQRREAARVDVPEEQTADRRVEAEPGRPMPERVPNVGVPTALLDQPVPLPRLATPPTTPDPASALAGLAEQLTRPRRSQPAPSPTEELDRAQSTATRPEMAEADTAGRPTLVAINRPYAGGEAVTDPPGGQTTLDLRPKQPDDPRGAAERPLPNIYRLRVAPDRSRLAERQGATPATEAAVKSALKWLADNQRDDGRWDASSHGAGREMQVLGRNRKGAGIEADTGMTGLALLALQASGHTHRKGHYRENVRRGLEYLLRVQASDGNLAGRADAYAKMYCHSMATFAMSEAYAMTSDRRLLRPVVRAINYTLAAQCPTDGGWRYRPGDPGDTSQAGWQLMALKSADLAGIPMPTESRNGLIRYLRSVSLGEHGGLASYRPNEQATRPMTAEALACWQFLGMPREHPAGNEAGDYLLGELPGEGRPNLYYWYYATLSMYQLQGVHWQRWNDALRATLVDSQRTSGPEAGSWNPDTVWGGYGGRVYSTALATLCLEVYYRYLPLYVGVAPADPLR